MSAPDRTRADADFVRAKFKANVERRNASTFPCHFCGGRHLHVLPKMDESGVAQEATGAATRMGMLLLVVSALTSLALSAWGISALLGAKS